MCVADVGSGKPLVMLHGFMSSKESFVYQTGYFSLFRRVIAIDLTGFGKSEKMSYPYALCDYEKAVLSVINALGLTEYDLLAHSFGARIAVKLAVRDERLKKLVLTGAAGLKPRRKPDYYIRIYAYKILKKLFKNGNFDNFGSEEYKKLGKTEKISYVKIVNEYLDGELKKINNDTLLVFGESDKETPVYMAKRLLKGIKNSSLYVVKGAGHFAFIDKPYEFNAIAGEFLKEG